MSKKIILFIGLIICFLSALACFGIFEKQKQTELEQTKPKQIGILKAEKEINWENITPEYFLTKDIFDTNARTDLTESDIQKGEDKNKMFARSWYDENDVPFITVTVIRYKDKIFSSEDHISEKPNPEDHISEKPRPEDHLLEKPTPEDYNLEKPRLRLEDHISEKPNSEDHILEKPNLTNKLSENTAMTYLSGFTFQDEIINEYKIETKQGQNVETAFYLKWMENRYTFLIKAISSEYQDDMREIAKNIINKYPK